MGDPRTPGATVLKADFSAYARWFQQPVHGIGLILALVGGSSISAIRGGDGAILFFIMAGTVVVTLGSIAILIATSRVTLGNGRIEYRRWFIRTRLRLDDDLVGALAEMHASSVGRTSQMLVLRARGGGRRICLNGAYWDQTDLVQIAETAGVLVSSRAMTPREYETVAPGTMSYHYLHPWVFGSGLGVVLIASIVGGVFAWFDIKDIPPFDEQPPRAVSASTVEGQDSLVIDLQRVIGGEWEPAEARLTTCRDDDYKGWSRDVSVDLREAVAETGEDEVVTPVQPTQDILDAIDELLLARGLSKTNADLAEMGVAEDAYLEVRSIPELDDRRSDTVTITFTRGRDASISIYAPCETPRR